MMTEDDLGCLYGDEHDWRQQDEENQQYEDDCLNRAIEMNEDIKSWQPL